MLEVKNATDMTVLLCSELIWQVLKNIPKECKDSDAEEVRKVIHNEFCRVINAGLTVLYPQPQDQLALMHKLLTQGM